MSSHGSWQPPYLLRGEESPINKSLRPGQQHKDYAVIKHAAASSLQTPEFHEQIQPRHQGKIALPVIQKPTEVFAQPITLQSKLNLQTSDKDGKAIFRPIEKKSLALPLLPQRESSKALKTNSPTSFSDTPGRVDTKRKEKWPKKNGFGFTQAGNNQFEGVSYTPYTLEDYKKIRFLKYHQLGGLGPAQVGSEDWRSRSLKAQRVKIYAEFVRRSMKPDPRVSSLEF